MVHRKTEHVDASPVPSVPASGRYANGRFAPGNAAALVHGGRSQQVRDGQRPEQGARRRHRADKRAALLSDLGGEASLSQLQRDLIDRYLELDTLAAWLGGHLMADSPLTAKGRTRAALSAYVTVVDRVHRLATALGVTRRPKPVSLETYVATRYARDETRAEKLSLEVVGVVPNGYFLGPAPGAQPNFVFLSEQQIPDEPGYSTVFYVRYAGGLDTLTPAIGAALVEVDSRVPILGMRTMDAQLESMTHPARVVTMLLGLFSSRVI